MTFCHRNREHVWAQSHGDFGPGTDLNFDGGGSAVSGCSGCLTDGASFEPRNSVTADVARMMFYLAVRHAAQIRGWPLGCTVRPSGIYSMWNSSDGA